MPYATTLAPAADSSSAVRAAEFPAPQIGVLFCVLMLLASIPIWTQPLPPLSDYVNHLARMHVIASAATDAYLPNYYEVDWEIVPNLMMDLVVPILGRSMSVYLAGQVFTIVSFALIMSGVLALNRALFGRFSLLPFLAMPLLYNGVFLVGVMNYIFGIGLALWATAAWIALRERPWPLRLTVASLFIVALFFCHLFAVGLYGIGLLAAELWRLNETRGWRDWRRLGDFTASGVPFLPVVPLMLASPTMKLAGAFSWESVGKIDGLAYVIQVYSDIVAFFLIGVITVATVWAVRHRLLSIHRMGWFLLAVSAVVYLAMPRVLFASYMADQRLPIAVAFMAIACIDLRTHLGVVRRGFIALVLILLAIRVIEVDVAWSNLSTTTSELRASVKRIKRGAKVLVAYADRTEGSAAADLGLVHGACIAMIERSALVTTAFTVVGKQIMHVRQAYRDFVDTEDGTPPSVEQLVLAADNSPAVQPSYWYSWPDRFDYLYILFTDDEATNPDPRHLTLLQNGDRFQLYRINRPATPVSQVR
jgi:hypothetical protein